MFRTGLHEAMALLLKMCSNLDDLPPVGEEKVFTAHALNHKLH